MEINAQIEAPRGGEILYSAPLRGRVRVNFVAMIRVGKLLESNINPNPNSNSALTLIMTLNSH